MSAIFLDGNALSVLKGIPDEFFHCAVTSPPYFGLRKYQGGEEIWDAESNCQHEWGVGQPSHHPGQVEQTKWKNAVGAGYGQTQSSGNFCIKCGAWRGQLGNEPTPDLYIKHIVSICREIRRVLRSDGVFWLNCGDSWVAGGGTQVVQTKNASHGLDGYRHATPTVKPLDMVLIPEQLALALRADGWYLRSILIWAKCLEGTMPIYCRSKDKPLRTTVKELARLPIESLYLPSAVGAWVKVRHIDTIGVRDVLTIHLRSGFRLQVTPEHRFPVDGKGLLPASDICVGDVLEPGILPDELGSEFATEEVGFIVGLYLAEGNLEKQSCVRFSLSANEHDLANKIKHLAWNTGADYREHRYNNSMAVIVAGRIFRGIIEQFIDGSGAKNKHLSRNCFRESNGFLDGLMRGYLAGDGHWDVTNKRWRIGFAWNYELLCDFRTVCSRLRWWFRAKGGNAKYQDGVKRIVRGEVRTVRSRPPHHSDREVVSVIPTSGVVYEIEVEGNHLFTLPDGTVTHNSNPMPESVSGWRYEKHKVKISAGRVKRHGLERGNGHVDESNVAEREDGASWQDCPGCPKCTPNDGLVLRKGSWRATDSFEQVFMLTKTSSYFCDREAVLEPIAPSTISRGKVDFGGAKGREYNPDEDDPNFRNGTEQWGRTYDYTQSNGNGGRNLRSVLTVPTHPFKGSHFATFPSRLIEPLIKAATSEKGCCPKCGSPWARVIEKPEVPHDGSTDCKNADDQGNTRRLALLRQAARERGEEYSSKSSTIGWRSTCSCGLSDVSPCRVLDAFSGAGTTALVCERLNLDSINIDTSTEYIKLACARLEDDEQKRIDEFIRKAKAGANKKQK
jgi:DNA modification methylase